MDKNSEKDSLNDILLSVSKTELADNSEIELVFGEEEKTANLVFENEDDKAPLTEIVFENVKKEKISEPVSEKKEEQKNIEFSIPEKFEVKENFVSVYDNEDKPFIRTTYIPRFTEASETFRMKNDPRPPVNKQKTEKASEMPVKEEIDPTAEFEEWVEIEEEETRQEIHTVSSAQEENDASTVFKFVQNEPKAETEFEEEKTHENVPEQPEEEDIVIIPVSEEVAEEIAEVESVSEEFPIPDPLSEGKSIVNYGASSRLSGHQRLVDAPENVGDKIENKKASRRSEYTSYAQRDSFKDKFLDSKMSIRVRFFAGVILAFVLLIVENLYIFGVDIPELLSLNTVPGAMAIIDMQFAVCLFLLTLPEIVNSFKQLRYKRAVPELALTVGFVVLLIYTLVIPQDPPAKYPLFGLLYSIMVLSAIGASYFKLSADFEAFKFSSINGEKVVVDQKHTRALERENSALDGIVEEHRSKTARFFKTIFVSDFFKRTANSEENTQNVLITLASSFGAAIVSGIIALFIPGGIANAISSFALVFLLAFPTFSLLVHKTPYYYSQEEALGEKSVLLGEKAIYDYCGIDVVTFDDTEVFGKEDINLQRIMLYGNSDNLSKALRQMSSLFMNVGGPLDILFSDSLDRKAPPAESTYIEPDGISGEIDGHKILAGPIDFMRRKGIGIPVDEHGVPMSSSESTRVMYAAEDGEIYAKFYIRYSFSEDFSMLLPVLDDEGITPLVYTRDPNITQELLRSLTAGNDKIRILKCLDSQADVTLYRSVSAGLVTNGDKNNAVNAIIITKKYSRFQSRLGVTSLIATAVGGVLAIVLSLGSMMTVPTFAFAIWQAAWCGVLHFVSARTFNKNKGI
jgi:cation transport ATPase